jgi:GGDEF domain-containing protein
VDYGNSTTDGKLGAADVAMMYVTNEQWGEATIREIKSRPKLFLKPLLIFSEEHLDGLKEIADGEIILPGSRAAVESTVEKLFSISQKIHRLAGIAEMAGESSMKEIVLLRFLYTREGYCLSPVRNLSSSLGYSYPLAQLLVDAAPGKELELIEELEENLLLTGKLIDRINLCPSCEHFQINVREVCPSCNSINLSEEATIHHYRCAYVGREKDFREGSALRCPKCRRELRHIGMDYDKPSEDLWCDECGANFSEPSISCSCLNCGTTFPPERAISRQIKEFSLTPEGNRAAEEGMLPNYGLMDILREGVGLYKLEVFKEFFKLEVLRCRRYEISSTLLHLVIEGFDNFIEQEGIKQAKSLRKELSYLFDATFRKTDIVTQLDGDENLIIFTHTDVDGVKRAVERLQEGIRNIFKKEINLTHRLWSLKDESEDLENILERLK